MNNSTIEIKEVALTPENIEELIALSGDWEAEGSCHGYHKNESSDLEGNRVFLATKGAEMLGYLFGRMEKTERTTSVMPEGTTVFEIEEIYVKPKYRSQGIGRALFSFAEKDVSPEAEYITLSTATKNWKAISHFYLDELGLEFWSARLFKKVTFDETVV